MFFFLARWIKEGGEFLFYFKFYEFCTKIDSFQLEKLQAYKRENFVKFTESIGKFSIEAIFTELLFIA